MIEQTLDLAVAAGTTVAPDFEGEHRIESVTFAVPGVEANPRKYSTIDWLANGIKVGIYDRATGEPREDIFDERTLAGNIHYDLLGLTWNLRTDIPADAEFAVKVQDDLTALEGHAVTIIIGE